jgi:hypothetical protein
MDINVMEPEGGQHPILSTPLNVQPSRTIIGGELVLTRFPDGSASFEPVRDENSNAYNPRRHFKENLALILDDQELREIGGTLRDAIDDDIESQSALFEAVSKMIKLMGLDLTAHADKDDLPFKGASQVFSAAAFETLQSLLASVRSLIFKSSGMANTYIVGDPTDELYALAERMKDWFNYYLKCVAKEYGKEAMQSAAWTFIAGSSYKKVYICPTLRRPVSQAIPVEDFIVNNIHSTHLTASRRTHILRLSEKDFNVRTLMGLYKDVDLAKDDDNDNTDDPIREQLNKVSGYDRINSKIDDIYSLYESHVDLCIKGDDHVTNDGIPSPYIVTLDRESGQVVGLYRNWKENDPYRTRIEYFVNYYMLTSLRGAGYGLVHYAGGLAEAATSLERQLINAAIYANFPGGVYQQGTRLENNNLCPAPGEFVPIMCSGAVQDAIQPLPYREPSPALNELKKDLEDSIRKPSAIIDQKAAEMPSNAPVGTTMAILEQLHRVPNAIMQNFYESLEVEFGLLKDRFEEWFPEGQPYPFKVTGGDRVIMKEDFREGVNVIPSADPTTKSSAHRFMESEIILNNAKASPDIYNLKYANELFLENLDIPAEDREKLLTPPQQETPQPQPMDPVSTMMAIIKGEPVTAAVWQDHEAYISIIDSWMQTNPQDPHLQNAMALKTQYEAFKYMVDAYAALGMQPPPDPSQLAPEQQNQLAVQIAHIKMQEVQAAQAAQQPAEQPLDPARVELEAAKMEAQVAHEKNELEHSKIELSREKMNMEFQLNVKEFELKTQIQHLKSEMESFKIAHEQAIKERDQALKEKDSMLEEYQHQMMPQVPMEQGEIY